MRRAGLGILLLLLAALPARAGFGLPEVGGLYRLPRAAQPEPGRLRLRLLYDYYYQDLGQGSRFHFHHGRAQAGLGLLRCAEAGLALDYWGRQRSASGLDTSLYDAIGGSDFSQGAGDGEAWLRLALPLPLDFLRIALQGNLRLGMGDEDSGLGAGAGDQEWRAAAALRLVGEPRFVETWLHLSAGLRRNRGEAGWGQAPSTDAQRPWSPWPAYYPSEDEAGGASRDHLLLGAGLEFLAEDWRLFGELAFEGYDPALGMALRENVWQVALGLDGPFYGGMRFQVLFHMSLARDDFRTDFEPHYPRLAHSFALSRDFELY